MTIFSPASKPRQNVQMDKTRHAAQAGSPPWSVIGTPNHTAKNIPREPRPHRIGYKYAWGVLSAGRVKTMLIVCLLEKNELTNG